MAGRRLLAGFAVPNAEGVVLFGAPSFFLGNIFNLGPLYCTEKFFSILVRGERALFGLLNNGTVKNANLVVRVGSVRVSAV